MLTLYQVQASGNCYRVRLMLSLLDLDVATVEIAEAGQLEAPWFRALNAFGEVPVLDDDGLALADLQAILVYLARRYGDATWLPTDAAPLAAAVRWLSFSANEIQNGPRMARGILKFARAGDLLGAQAKARLALERLDVHLAQGDWLAGPGPTVADIACYPYVHVAQEGGIETTGFSHLDRWLRRIEALQRFLPLEAPYGTMGRRAGAGA